MDEIGRIRINRRISKAKGKEGKLLPLNSRERNEVNMAIRYMLSLGYPKKDAIARVIGITDKEKQAIIKEFKILEFKWKV